MSYKNISSLTTCLCLTHLSFNPLTPPTDQMFRDLFQRVQSKQNKLSSSCFYCAVQGPSAVKFSSHSGRDAHLFCFQFSRFNISSKCNQIIEDYKTLQTTLRVFLVVERGIVSL